jgi:hypothetical protein
MTQSDILRPSIAALRKGLDYRRALPSLAGQEHGRTITLMDVNGPLGRAQAWVWNVIT